MPALDGLRGLAIALVLLRHFTEGVEPSSSAGRWTMALLDAGWVGVDLFFVLSGFLITGILLDAKGTKHYFRNFYMRRTLRIFPLYYGVLIVIYGIAPLAGWLQGRASALDETAPGWLWTYTTNISMALSGDPNVKRDWLNLNHFWSLAVEEHFYLLWPAVVHACSRRRVLAIAAALIVTAPLLRLGLSYGSSLAPYVITPCRVDSLALGALLAALVRGPLGIAPWIKPARAVLALSVASLAAILIVRGTFVFWDRGVLTAGYSLLASTFGALVVLTVAAREGSLLSRTFSLSPLRSLGKYSYGIYVFHYLLLAAFDRVFATKRLADALGSFELGLAAHVALCCAASIAIAFASWHLYEKHFIKLKRYFEPTWDAVPGVAAGRVESNTPRPTTMNAPARGPSWA